MENLKEPACELALKDPIKHYKLVRDGLCFYCAQRADWVRINDEKYQDNRGTTNGKD